MKYLLLIPIVVLFAPSVSRAEDVPFPSQQLGTAVHASMAELCSGNVLSTAGDEIVWTDYSSKLSPEQLIAAYKSKLGETGFKAEGEGGDWNFSNERHLTITSAKDFRSKSGCDKKPPYGSRSVVEISAFYKRSK